jgi:tetratricopeptide (TPR) repeat protein
VLALKSDHEGAISHYRRSLESDPGSALTHFQLGLSLAMLGREEDSRRHFRESIRLDPRNRTRLARTVLGTLERSEGPRERTMALRLAKLAAEPGEVGNAIVFEALAAGYAANGRLPEAVESGERAVRLAAADPEIDAAERARIAQRLERYRLGASR